MKKLLLFFTFFSVFSVSAQKNWVLINAELKNETDKLKEVIPIVNEETGNFAVFLKGKKEFKASLFDENQNLLFKPILIENLPKKSNIFLNYAFSKEEYTLFFKNNSGNKFSSIHVNFETGEHKINDDLQLKIKKEKIVETFQDGSKLYILSIKNESSKCILYSVNLDNVISKKEIDLTPIPFEEYKGYKLNLSDFLTNTYGGNEIGKINFNEPNSLEKASSYNKLFYNNGKITLLNNFYDNYTYIIDIYVNDGAYNYQKINNKGIEEKPIKLGSNSFVFENYFFSVNSTPKKLNFNIYNYKTKEVLKEYQILKDEPIIFKNTPIIHEGGDFDSYRELEKTSQFLKKISNPNLGVSIYRNKNNYVVTLGASKEVASGGFQPSAFGGFIGGAIGGALFSTFDSYNQSKFKSTRIECLFDENFNHIQGEIPKNGFDKINSFLEEKDLKNMPFQTVFRYNNDYIWGSYNKTSKIYRFYKF
ncbi:MAG: hypothetical protein GY936_15370 [Ignavibacteriae bacterium]|nr:hypothetical protein [Ignavibacteriota bacterium]